MVAPMDPTGDDIVVMTEGPEGPSNTDVENFVHIKATKLTAWV